MIRAAKLAVIIITLNEFWIFYSEVIFSFLSQIEFDYGLKNSDEKKYEKLNKDKFLMNE